MNPNQRRKYWAEWKKAKAAMKARGLTDAECDEHRLICHAVARGADVDGPRIGSDELTDAELSAVLEQFLNQQGEASITESREDARKRRQYVYSIKKEQPHAGWAPAVADDIYKTRRWEALPLRDLLTLRRRVATDARRRSSKLQSSSPQTA